MPEAPRVVPAVEGGMTGAVALRGEQRAAWVLGRVVERSPRGPHAWVALDGHGVARGEDASLLRELYAVAGAPWVADGILDHYVVTPADGPLLAVWETLGFAREQVHGARETGGEPPLPDGFVIRRGGRADLELALTLADAIFRAHQAAPVWSGVSLPDADELRADWAELLADPGTAYFLAEDGGGAPLGHLVLADAGDGTIELHIAATREDARGRGVGAALCAEALAWAARQGYTRCVADWRIANLSSDGFWRRRGFVPVTYRLVRRVRPPV